MRISTVRRLVTLAAALGAFATAAEPREPGAESTPRISTAAAPDLPRRGPGITLYFFDVHRQLEGHFADLAAETGAIFREMGAEVTWREGGLGTTFGSADSLEIPIIVLQTPPKGIANTDNVLGLVPRNPTGSKAVWIFVDNIRRVLGTSSEPSRDLGVAVGRVIAHEVVHALAPKLAHTRQGLMREALSRAALTEPARPAHDRCVSAVQAAIGIVAASPAPVSTESALLLRPPLF